MSGGWLSGAFRFVFWDFRRGSWQYDVTVGLILAFIFLTPRVWFRDQPKARSVVLLPAEAGSGAFWVDPELLNGLQGPEKMATVEKLVQSQTGGRNRKLVRLESIYDEEQDLKGYMAFTQP